MSKLVEAEIPCNNCGLSNHQGVYVSVNITVDPELKEKILSGSLFRFRCRICKSYSFYKHDLLYHEMAEKKVMIWLKIPDEDNTVFFDPLTLSDRVTRIMKGYKFFITRNVDHLIERINSIDFGWDSRVLELYKFLIKSKNGLPLETEHEYLFFGSIFKDEESNTIMHFMNKLNANEPEEFEVKLDEEVLKISKRFIDFMEPELDNKWYIIDWQFPFGQSIKDNEKFHLPRKS